MGLCVNCGKTPARKNYTYCSNQCQMDFQHAEYIRRWKKGEVDDIRGIRATSISSRLVRHLRELYGESCTLCGWKERSIYTGRVPLEIDHIDGNSDNNIEANLRLICPNCHSLTANFRNLNKGNGRSWRRAKYIKNK